MKLGPKEIKVVNQYFVRPVKNKLKEIFMKKGLPQLKTPDEVQRPDDALRREMFEDANKRFNKADGGRIGFSEGTNPFEIARGKRKGLYAVRSRLNVDNVADAVDSSEDFIYFKNKTDANNFYNSLARRGSETYIGK